MLDNTARLYPLVSKVYRRNAAFGFAGSFVMPRLSPCPWRSNVKCSETTGCFKEAAYSIRHAGMPVCVRVQAWIQKVFRQPQRSSLLTSLGTGLSFLASNFF